MLPFAIDLAFIEGDSCKHDVRKKLRNDIGKVQNLDELLRNMSLQLFDCLPQVMQTSLLDPLNNCRCQFTFHRICEDSNLKESDGNETTDDNNKFPISESTIPEHKDLNEVAITRAYTGLDSGLGTENYIQMTDNLNLVPDDQPISDSAADMFCEKGPVVQCEDSSIPAVSSNEGSQRMKSDLIQEAFLGDAVLSREGRSSENSACCRSGKENRALCCLKIATRSLGSKDSQQLKSQIELRPSTSIEEQCSSHVMEVCRKDEREGNSYFQHPQPPGSSCSSMDFKISQTVKRRKGQELIHYTDGILGQGGYGIVIKARDPLTGAIFALKKVKFMEDNAADAKNEVEIMVQLNHRSIIRILGAERLNNEYHIFLEWMAGGSVEKLLSLHGPFDEAVIWNYSEQVVAGLAYLHSRGIIHCDVRGANILVDSSGLLAKLCDFGLAMQLPVCHGTKPRGTLAFRAWELFDGLCNSPGSDVWSFGCTMIQMATAKQPWNDEFSTFRDTEENLIWKICTSELPMPPSLSADMQWMIKKCLEFDVSCRPIASHLQHQCEILCSRYSSFSPE